MREYRAAGADALTTVSLDLLTAVYHRPSGITHLLAQPAPEIIAALAGGWSSLPALMARLAARFELDHEAPGALLARVEELVAAGLVEAR